MNTMRKSLRLKAALFAVTLTTGAALLVTPEVAQAGPTLDAIKSKGVLRCGVNTGLVGFSAPDSTGKWTGLDSDFCKAVAAAILGDASKVQYVPTNAQNRFTALQSGEVDMLSRNTTWTSSRDSTLGAVFAGTLFAHHHALPYLICGTLAFCTGLLAWKFLTKSQPSAIAA